MLPFPLPPWLNYLLSFPFPLSPSLHHPLPLSLPYFFCSSFSFLSHLPPHLSPSFLLSIPFLHPSSTLSFPCSLLYFLILNLPFISSQFFSSPPCIFSLYYYSSFYFSLSSMINMFIFHTLKQPSFLSSPLLFSSHFPLYPSLPYHPPISNPRCAYFTKTKHSFLNKLI